MHGRHGMVSGSKNIDSVADFLTECIICQIVYKPLSVGYTAELDSSVCSKPRSLTLRWDAHHRAFLKI